MLFGIQVDRRPAKSQDFEFFRMKRRGHGPLLSAATVNLLRRNTEFVFERFKFCSARHETR